jgi:hypothetical protein
MSVPQRFMDFNFDEQFVSLSFLIDAFLGDDLCSEKFSLCAGNSLVALGKTTRSQQLAFVI